jgi:pimeloyl-ACP methyl ester carboxylesterase
MRLFRIACMICLLLLPATSRGADDLYGYPPFEAYEATILGTPDYLKPEPPEDMTVRLFALDVIPNLAKPDVFFYDEGLRCTLAYQEKEAPLVFIIPGTGAGDRSHKVIAMMMELYKAGYHVLSLPSPTHPNFIISASRSHVPGNLPEDAEDIYRVMEMAWNRVKGDIKVSEFHLAGYSLGGTQAAFVAKLDAEKKVFRFRKVLLVNPAVNLYNSVMRIEGLLDRIPGGPRRIGAYFNRMMAKFTDFYRQGDYVDFNEDLLYAVFKNKLFTRDESGGLIGLSFRVSLAGMIFSSDVMTSGGYVVPKNRVLTGTDPLGEYLLVSMHLSFLDYFDEYFLPFIRAKQPGLTREDVIAALGFRSIEGFLKAAPGIGVLTNEDDFILTPEDLAYLRTLFGSRAKIYPRGGHMGNLEYRTTMTDLVAFFKEGEGP